MNRLTGFALHAGAAMVFCFGVGRTYAQAQAPAQTPTTPAAEKPAEADSDDDEDGNPFAPEPSPTLPAGMSGSDASDPRAKLTPGVYDAGETARGIKHLQLVKKPDAFQLGATDPDDPKVQKVISQMGVSSMGKIPKEMHIAVAG